MSLCRLARRFRDIIKLLLHMVFHVTEDQRIYDSRCKLSYCNARVLFFQEVRIEKKYAINTFNSYSIVGFVSGRDDLIVDAPL